VSDRLMQLCVACQVPFDCDWYPFATRCHTRGTHDPKVRRPCPMEPEVLDNL
jgi:hypothetical protein